MSVTVRQIQAMLAEHRALTRPRVPAPPPDEPAALPGVTPPAPPPAPPRIDAALTADAAVAAVDDGEPDPRAVELVGDAVGLAPGEVPVWAASRAADWAAARAAVEDVLGHPRGAALDRDGLLAAASTYARITEG